MDLNTVYNEDCLIGMQRIPDKSIDMILCDLPYGTTELDWDSVIPFEALWMQYERIIKNNGAIALTAQQPFATDLINSKRALFRYEIIWEKTQKLGFCNAHKMPLRGHENILLFYKKLPVYNPQKYKIETKQIGRLRKPKNGHEYKGYSSFNKDGYQWKEDGTRFPHSVIKISNWNGALFGNNKNATKHPTQKPVPLFEWLIKTYTNEGDTVLDNCAGSGTTAIACINTNRNYILFEKKEKYFNIIQDRIENHKNNYEHGLFNNGRN